MEEHTEEIIIIKSTVLHNVTMWMQNYEKTGNIFITNTASFGYLHTKI